MSGEKPMPLQSRLDSFQREVLEAFFARTDAFFLTGGAALAGFYLGHRDTKDLDLFTDGERMEDGVAALQDSARSLGATLEAIQTSPDFRRFLLRREAGSVVVDLVRDRSRQAFPDKPVVNGIRIDPVEEILANKLCTLLSRGEVRDLVDVLMLERAGYSIAQALGPASLKDGGLTAAQLGWVLSQIQVGDDARIPGEVTVEELRAFLSSLVSRLALLAKPT